MTKFLWVVVFSIVLVIQVKCFELSTNTKLFSVSLYSQIVKNDNKNVCFSPLSAEIALSLLYLGARGDTAKEIKKALHIPDSTNKIEHVFKKFFNSITSTEDLSLHSANKVYIKENLPVRPNFLNITQKAFQADVENIDFGDITKATQTINQWVKTQTQNKIQNLIDPTALKSDTVALLINALYLKAKWTHEFDSSETKKVKFYKNNNEVIEVDGMSFFLNQNSFKYAENEALDAKILEFGFGNQSAGNSMVVVLPNNKTGLEKIQNKLDIALATKLEEDIVEIMLPKFKVETHLDLKGILQNVSVKLD